METRTPKLHAIDMLVAWAALPAAVRTDVERIVRDFQPFGPRCHALDVYRDNEDSDADSVRQAFDALAPFHHVGPQLDRVIEALGLWLDGWRLTAARREDDAKWEAERAETEALLAEVNSMISRDDADTWERWVGPETPAGFVSRAHEEHSSTDDACAAFAKWATEHLPRIPNPTTKDAERLANAMLRHIAATCQHDSGNQTGEAGNPEDPPACDDCGAMLDDGDDEPRPVMVATAGEYHHVGLRRFRRVHVNASEWTQEQRHEGAGRGQWTDQPPTLEPLSVVVPTHWRRIQGESLADEHDRLCHADGSPCPDGCDAAPLPDGDAYADPRAGFAFAKVQPDNLIAEAVRGYTVEQVLLPIGTVYLHASGAWSAWSHTGKMLTDDSECTRWYDRRYDAAVALAEHADALLAAMTPAEELAADFERRGSDEADERAAAEDAAAEAEARWLAGSAFGNQGLANHGGLDTDPHVGQHGHHCPSDCSCYAEPAWRFTVQQDGRTVSTHDGDEAAFEALEAAAALCSKLDTTQTRAQLDDLIDAADDALQPRLSRSERSGTVAFSGRFRVFVCFEVQS